MQIRRFIPLFFCRNKFLLGATRLVQDGLRPWQAARSSDPRRLRARVSSGGLGYPGSALVLGLSVCARPEVRAEGPVAGKEADDHAADHQGGDTEAQDPTQGGRLRKGFHRSGVPQSPAEKKSNDSKGLHSSPSAASRGSKAGQRRLTVKALGSEACQL